MRRKFIRDRGVRDNARDVLHQGTGWKELWFHKLPEDNRWENGVRETKKDNYVFNMYAQPASLETYFLRKGFKYAFISCAGMKKD